MPLKKGHSAEIVSHNIKQMMGEGYPKKQAVAIALSSKRKYSKMAHGGLLEDFDDEADSAYDEEADRTLAQVDKLSVDLPDAVGPKQHDMSFKLAKALQEAEEKMEGQLAAGGMVVHKGEDDTPTPMASMELTEEQKTALAQKKAKRKFK